MTPWQQRLFEALVGALGTVEAKKAASRANKHERAKRGHVSNMNSKRKAARKMAQRSKRANRVSARAAHTRRNSRHGANRRK
jgi:hypothetical protein